MTGARTPGQLNYEGYCARTGGKSLISGDTLPAWADLDPVIQQAWEAGAMAVARGVALTGEVEYRDGG